MPRLERQDTVFVLDLGDDETRFHPDWIAAVEAALEEVASAEGPRALVTTGTGKFYSNGLDLEWVGAHQDQFGAYLDSVHALFARMLSLPVMTVAAIQGHAFAAGGMLTLAHDVRVMRADRGFWCLPEVDIDMPFTEGMAALVQARLTAQAAHETMTTGRRYGGLDAHALGIVDRTADEDNLSGAAVDLARELSSKAGPTLGAIKSTMYAPALAVLSHHDASS